MIKRAQKKKVILKHVKINIVKKKIFSKENVINNDE